MIAIEGEREFSIVTKIMLMIIQKLLTSIPYPYYRPQLCILLYWVSMKPLTFFAKFAASSTASMNKINNQFLMTTGRNHRLALTKSNIFYAVDKQ